jgi:cyclopropane-fatty-acyl-phospholipid synthase
LNTQILPKDYSLSKLLASSPKLDSFCRGVLIKKLQGLKNGKVTLIDESGKKPIREVYGDLTSEISATVIVKNSSFYSRTTLGGSIGNAESYVDGDWECDKLANLVRIFVLNRDTLNALDGGIGKILNPIQKYIHGLRGNTVKGSRENIRAHYDIGNDFFKLFLDDTMMYSSALFERADDDLKVASVRKIKMICDRLRLKSSDRVVEIGTGWGSLAIYAAQNYGCHVTTTTISTEQFNYTNEKVKELGLEDKVTVLFEDYRKLTGTYDKLVSVEMIEAVGLENLPTYFQKCSSLLKEDGLMVIQAITIRDSYYENAKNSVDFIQRHIFPGGGLPSVHAMMESVMGKTDLILLEQKDYAEDYAQTLLKWSDNLKLAKDKITELGYPDYLYRLWNFYFAYCEGGFRERAIGLSQMVFTKPLYRERTLL